MAEVTCMGGVPAYTPARHGMREVQETSETLDAATRGRRGGRGFRTGGVTRLSVLMSKPSAGSALQGEANPCRTASGGCETGGTGDLSEIPEHAEPGERAWSQGARTDDVLEAR